MIVYNVNRRWFTKKVEADAYRVAEKRKPAELIEVEVKTREDLAALLNALCDPPLAKGKVEKPATDELVDRAYVRRETPIPDYIPDFLLKDWGLTRKDKS